MWLIISLVIIGALLLIAELVLLPGFTVAGVGAIAADIAAVWIAFARYGGAGGAIAIGAVIVISGVATMLALRANTWQRLSLKDNIDGTSQQLPQEDNLNVGDRGKTITRLAPMGKVAINGKSYEAKSIDAYIDQNTGIEVCGFENFSVIVKKI